MKLGPLDLENRYILAPMLNVTTAPYRRFCRKLQKIGLVYVPMLYTKKIEKNPKLLEKELFKIEEEKPIGVQLIGSDPNALRITIDHLDSYKFDVLDLNAGCPSKRAIKAQEGGYLMKDLKKLSVLIKTAVKYSSRPVSLKIRTGFEKPIKIGKLTKIINNSGIDLLIIHARNVLSKFDGGTLDLDTVKRLKERLVIPIVGNGNIFNPITAKHFIDYTDVDALMIGRESMGNPEIFNQLHEYFTKGKEAPLIINFDTIKNYIQVYEECIDEYLNGVLKQVDNEEIKFIELKRNAIWLTKNIRNSAMIRYHLSHVKNLKHLKNTIHTFFPSGAEN
ncbi:MAG: tRNA dihydrouridine synthase [Candidatus Hodarchaeota archaeon]